MLAGVFYLILVALLSLWIQSSLNANTNSLILRKAPAEALDEWLKGFQWGQRSDLSSPLHPPVYKFYSEIVELLLSLARRMGGNYQSSLLFLRDGLQADRQFEKKLRELNLGCWLQMGLVSLLTWAFIVGALGFVKVTIPSGRLALLGGWQLLGFGTLPLLLRWLRRRYFADIGKLWKILYVLHSLSRVPMARSDILNLAGVAELKNITQASLSTLVEKLTHTCKEALKQGTSYETEVKYLMDELRFVEKWHFELFEKRLTAIKLGLLGVFFLPAYLAFVFFLLGDLMRTF